MPHALLLSPDDQAVNAITGVLEEMSVSCERPLDGVSAAQKLNSRSFDLVLVDCENLPAAKLIFDVCRRGNNGHNPVPIAIVDGRAGLPTAFRLGAELILTKPVAKDQARTTIRTAVSRVRKDAPAEQSVSTQPPGSSAAHKMQPSAHAAAAAAAAAGSPQLTSFADPVPNFASSPIPSAAASSAPAATLSAAAATGSAPAVELNPAVEETLTAAAPADSSPNPASLVNGPELVTVETAHPEDAQLTKSPEKILGIEESEKASADSPAPKLVASKASSRQGQRKTSQSLVALLALVIALGGFYAAWMYQPGFRTIAQPQIDHLLGLVGMAPLTNPAASPATVSVRPAVAAAPAPAPVKPSDLAHTQPTTSATSDTTTAPPAAPIAPQTPATAATAVVPPASVNKITTAPAVTPVATTSASQPVEAKIAQKNDAKNGADSTTLANTPLPGENSAVILSSKGAEKRLMYSVAPKYPAEVHAAETEATVVLKTAVDRDGKVAGVRLVEGNAALATAAIQAVKQWRYRPYLRDGKPQSFQTVVIVDFHRP